MSLVRFIILVALIGGILGLRGVKAQESGIDEDPVLIRLKAKLVSAGDSMPVPYANIVYPRHRVLDLILIEVIENPVEILPNLGRQLDARHATSPACAPPDGPSRPG